MAEEVGTIIPGEGSQQHSNAVVLEEKAREKGWKPREESDLPEEEWVDAKEFLGRQPLFDRIHNLQKELKNNNLKFQEDLNKVSAHMLMMQKAEYEKQIKELKAEKKIAIEEGNLAAVEAINDEIKETEQKQKEVKQPAVQNTHQQALQEEFVQWRSENKWFDSDPELQKEAIAIGTGYAAINQGKTQADVLSYIKERIQKIYPEKFQKRKPEPSKVESASNNSGINPAKSKSKGISEDDLSDMEKSIMNTLIKRGVLKSKAEKNKVSEKEQYLRDLAEAKGLN